MGKGIFKDTTKVGLITPLDIDYMDLDGFEESIAHHFIVPSGNYNQIPIILLQISCQIKNMTYWHFLFTRTAKSSASSGSIR